MSILIPISANSKSSSYYANLIKTHISKGQPLEFSGLGLAISRTIKIVEDLKKAGLITVEKIETSIVEIKTRQSIDNPEYYIQQKPKISIIVQPVENFSEIVLQRMAANQN
ncbi:DNA/RNA-binding protein alba 3 [Anaeramoeba ignava]|uniref:DNA/RNA-binding protein alba 3 n=1 Tax=Anaeramoeba ignava TaxID=1746090 RepID=A0A9Q0LGK8_ANAIG|nr:DNA/RNA-binding protein alba 3 [Anaeramoeba ignava]|eukprot:Anaeramoba_ignava/a110265_106.p1 GENE.a110265_106~~a110265_106.p1  ORF type:complete len:118 (-),score=30.35 a110265_106:12-344(-)